jgi:ElaB/YqjD/DUF883 family membrane-anchored ribosome-binding protein
MKGELAMDNESSERSNRSHLQTAAATAARMKRQVSDAAEEARHRAGDMAEAAANEIEEQREHAAVAFDKTAAALRQRGERLSDAAQAASERLHSTADYLHAHDANEMVEDLKELVRRHPGPAVAAAMIFGFVSAVFFKRNSQ